MSPKKGLDPSSKVGRIAFQMKDLSVRMKPEVRGVIVRILNTLETTAPDDAGLRFRLREDLDRLGKEPQLAGLAKRLFKELPST